MYDTTRKPSAGAFDFSTVSPDGVTDCLNNDAVGKLSTGSVKTYDINKRFKHRID